MTYKRFTLPYFFRNSADFRKNHFVGGTMALYCPAPEQCEVSVGVAA
jgi:hypothetical protein